MEINKKKIDLTKKALQILLKNKKVTIVYKNTKKIELQSRKMLKAIIAKDYETIEYIR